MARKTQLDIVREAIEIQGYIEVYVNGQPRQCREIKVVNGEWVTDILTSDLCGHVRIKKTKRYVVDQAKRIVANADEIRANREAKEARATWSMMN
ncbi:MAG TPA: hypothetical protein VF226_17145 [Hyphomicrobiaceae bacterium]